LVRYPRFAVLSLKGNFSMARIRPLRRARPTHLLAGLVLLTSVGVPLLETPVAKATSPTASASTNAKGDFNNDGYADIAVSIPLATVTVALQGAVAVIYGTAHGLDPAAQPAPQFLTEGGPNGPKPHNAWGLSLAAGDFNGDGFGDLAVGANAADVALGGDNEGSVTILSGSPGGLKPVQTAYLTAPTPTNGEQFGFFLAAGDFNGDGSDDLAVNAINKAVNGLANAGAVFLYAGGGDTPSGLDPASPVQLDESTAHVPGTLRALDQFGVALAAGDLNSDGRADLAVGIPGRKVGGKAEAGAVHVFNGCTTGSSCNGLVATDGEDFKLNELPGRQSQTGALFGLSLAIGDFGRDGAQDLAIGIPGYNANGQAGAGAVAVLYSSGAAGLSVDGYDFLVEGSGGIPGTSGPSDNFGNVLAAGNLGKSAHADLAIGTTFKTIASAGGPLARAGQVHVLYGSATGIAAAGAQVFTQGGGGVPGTLTAGGGFGKMIMIANFAGGEVGQLAVASRDTVDGQINAGAVTILGAGPDGIATPPAATGYLTATNANIGHPAAAGEIFGGAFGQPGLAG
jgi:hypothetical protein